jgi:hypothetical protein
VIEHKNSGRLMDDSNGTLKLHYAIDPLWLDMLAALGTDLKTHEAVVREIADVLMRCGSIAGSPALVRVVPNGMEKTA